MIQIIRWLLGYVKFVAKGIFPERFMNLISRSSITIWDTKRKGNELSACIIASEYKELKTISRKTGSKLKIEEKHGLPFLINRYKKRKGLLVGLLLFCSILYILSIYVWQVEIIGNETIASDEIKTVLSDMGLSQGSIKNNLDLSYISESMMAKMPNLAWVSININGSCAEISIKERFLPPNVVAKAEPCNIKSNCDAQIERMEVFGGTAMVKPGDAVVKGQLLVSGVFEDPKGRTELKHSEAKILAYTKKSVTNEIELWQEKREPTNKVIERKKIRMFGIEIPLSLVPVPKWDCKKEANQNDIKIFEKSLPITLYKEIYTKEIVSHVLISEQEAEVQGEAFLNNYEQTELKNSKIVDRNVTGFVNEQKYILTANYYCLENIGYQESIEVE